MAKLEEYADKYEFLRMERRDGILQVTFHLEGRSLEWTSVVQRELGNAFADIGSDADTKVVILTGTGDAFCDKWPGPAPPVYCHGTGTRSTGAGCNR